MVRVWSGATGVGGEDRTPGVGQHNVKSKLQSSRAAKPRTPVFFQPISCKLSTDDEKKIFFFTTVDIEPLNLNLAPVQGLEERSCFT